MKTQDLEIFAPGISPVFARALRALVDILRRIAASFKFSVMSFADIDLYRVAMSVIVDGKRKDQNCRVYLARPVYTSFRWKLCSREGNKGANAPLPCPDMQRHHECRLLYIYQPEKYARGMSPS